MRTTIKHPDSKYRVELEFFHNGITLSYFDNKEEIPYWIKAMQEKHGRITKSRTEEL